MSNKEYFYALLPRADRAGETFDISPMLARERSVPAKARRAYLKGIKLQSRGTIWIIVFSLVLFLFRFRLYVPSPAFGPSSGHHTPPYRIVPEGIPACVTHDLTSECDIGKSIRDFKYTYQLFDTDKTFFPCNLYTESEYLRRVRMLFLY